MAPKGRKRFAIDGMSVTRGIGIRPGAMDGGVDGEGGGVDGFVAVDDSAFLVYEDEVGDSD
jgi:hypothetical protein